MVEVLVEVSDVVAEDGPGYGYGVGAARRRLGFTWHLAPQWPAERGGERAHSSNPSPRPHPTPSHRGAAVSHGAF